jgi:hypothetical protein
MKKIVLAGLFAIGLIALSQQQASAWRNSKFSIGLNWEGQSGNNQFLWGTFRNGQVPGPEAFGGGQVGQGGQGYGASMPQFYVPAPQRQRFAPVPQGYPPQGSSDATMREPPLASQYASPYQFATYPREVYYYYYPAPAYYYYSYGR